MGRGKGNKKSHNQRKQKQSEPVKSIERQTDLNSSGSSSINEIDFTNVNSDTNAIFKVDLESEKIDYERYIAQCNSLSEILKNLQVELNRRVAVSFKKDGYVKWKSGQLEQAKISLEKSLDIEKNTEIQAKLKELDTLIQAEKVNIEKAEKLKELGNISYRKREFDVALNYYNDAIKLNNNNMMYHSNKAAVYFEQKDYDVCVRLCDLAIDVGLRTKAENKLIANAMNRMALSYQKMYRLEDSVEVYEKSLKIYHSEEIVTKFKKLRDFVDKLSTMNDVVRRVISFDNDDYMKMGQVIEEVVSHETVKEAEKLIELGDITLKSLNYEEALYYYDAAIKLDNNNIIYLTKKAFLNFEMFDYGDCIRQCDLAIDVGYRTNAGNKLIAKVMFIMASSFMRINDPENMLENSFEIHHSEEIASKLARTRDFVEKSLANGGNEENEIKYEEFNGIKMSKEPNVERARKMGEYGDICYKNQNYDMSLYYYDAAILNDSKNMIYLSKKAAVCFEMMGFGECIAQCNLAILTGRKKRSNSDLIAEAYFLMASSFMRMNNREDGTKIFENSFEVDHANEISGKFVALKRMTKGKLIFQRMYV